MNTCISCKHFKQEGIGIIVDSNPNPKNAMCMHPQAVTRDPIYGNAFCQVERGAGGKACGKNGKLWEAANT